MESKLIGTQLSFNQTITFLLAVLLQSLYFEMKIFVHNWVEVATKHYSTLAFYLICALILIPEFIYYFLGVDTNPVIWGRWLIASAIFGLLGKFVVQTDSHKWKRRFFIGLVFALAAAVSIPALAHAENRDEIAFELIAKWEGKRNHAYLDIVQVPTICYGSTRGVNMGDYKSDAECKELLIDEIKEYRNGVETYFTNITKNCRMTDKRNAAYTSLAYNVGYIRAGKSTATRRLNKGNIEGGCEAISWWNKAGGRRVRGLVNRRAEEVEYCMAGL